MLAQPDAFLAAVFYSVTLTSALVVSFATLMYTAFNFHIFR